MNNLSEMLAHNERCNAIVSAVEKLYADDPGIKGIYNYMEHIKISSADDQFRQYMKNRYRIISGRELAPIEEKYKGRYIFLLGGTQFGLNIDRIPRDFAYKDFVASHFIIYSFSGLSGHFAGCRICDHAYIKSHLE